MLEYFSILKFSNEIHENSYNTEIHKTSSKPVKAKGEKKTTTNTEWVNLKQKKNVTQIILATCMFVWKNQSSWKYVLYSSIDFGYCSRWKTKLTIVIFVFFFGRCYFGFFFSSCQRK